MRYFHSIFIALTISLHIRSSHLPRWILPRAVARSFLVALPLGLISILPNGPALSANDWTDRNRLAAETWRTVDDRYNDRTFGGQDWFKLRQDVVKRNYKTDDEVYASLKSMLAKIGDKYTRFLTPAEYSALVNSATGELTGVGLELLQLNDGSVKVNNIAEGSPAENSGIEIGDILLNVDGTDAWDKSAEDVAVAMRGKEGTKASVRVKRGGGPEGKVLDFTVVRKPIRLKGVSSRIVKLPSSTEMAGAKKTAKSVFVIAVRSFSSTTRDDITAAMEKFHSSEEDGDVILMDLRNNGGGLLEGAVDTAALFLPPGKIVTYVVSKGGAQVGALQTLPSSVRSTDTLLPDTKTPLFVLVNENTASAAEVLSAALKENGRATLVGTQTFGKGVIQEVTPLSREAGVAVTVSAYETPLHNNINKVGIPVDKNLVCEPTTAAETCTESFLLQR